jgi:hypothetical protein
LTEARDPQHTIDDAQVRKLSSKSPPCSAEMANGSGLARELRSR